MLGNIVVYLFLAIILGLMVAYAAYAWQEYRARRSARTLGGESGFDGTSPRA